MPTKRLPQSAHIDHLKHQAKDLLTDFRAGEMQALQRAREFHPNCHDLPDAELAKRTFSLSDAQLAIAREYGYASWPRLKIVVAEASQSDPGLIHNDRIADGPFKQALDFLDAGDAVRLRRHLALHPELATARVRFEGDNYFTEPSLLQFVAENPIRQGCLPSNIVEIAEIILSAGAAEDRAALDETLALVASGRIAREAGAQSPLLRLLCAHGADPNAGMKSALGHGEFSAAQLLIELGATLDLSCAAALGRVEDVDRHLPGAPSDAMQLGLSLAALHGHAEIVARLLRAGADPDRYNPQGAHSHSTPLHSAAFAGHLGVARTLIEAGARLDIPDIHHGATPLGWAKHAGHANLAAFLKASAAD